MAEALPPPQTPQPLATLEPSRRSSRVVRPIVVLLGVAFVAGALAYATAARADAQQSWQSSQRWAERAAAQESLVFTQNSTIGDLTGRTERLEEALMQTTTLLEGRTAEAQALRDQLDAVAARLATAEAQLAELAGERARATDQVLANR